MYRALDEPPTSAMNSDSPLESAMERSVRIAHIACHHSACNVYLSCCSRPLVSCPSVMDSTVTRDPGPRLLALPP